MFRSIAVYIKLSRDQVEITNLDTGTFVSKSAVNAFPGIRNILSNFNNAHETIKSALKEPGIKHSIFSPALKVLIQQIEGTEGGLSDIEKRALRDFAEMSGARRVRIPDHSRALTVSEALMALEAKWHLLQA